MQNFKVVVKYREILYNTENNIDWIFLAPHIVRYATIVLMFHIIVTRHFIATHQFADGLNLARASAAESRQTQL